ncbi:MAG: VOC family protein [Xanthomonadales bacterium]|nr:VOC family protein [Xanthomonadales bacterium]
MYLVMRKSGMNIIALLLVLISANAYSDKSSFDIQMDHVTLMVSDVDRSANFYLKFLMLTEFETPWGKTPMGRMFSIGSAGEIHLAKGEKPDHKPNKRVHTAFRIAEFDEYLLFLEDNGVKFGNFEGDPGVFQTRPDGVRQVYFQDPDGYWIEVNSAPVK